MPKPTRDPQKDLYHNDYLPWIMWVDEYLDEHTTDSEYPSELHAELKPLIPVFAAALSDYQTKKDDEDAASTDYTGAYKSMLNKMRICKKLLPTIIDDPSVPAEFSLENPLPRDRDDLWVRAQACVNNWIEVCDPAMPPEYTSLAPQFDEVATLFGKYTDARNAFASAQLDAVDAQNTLLEAREACHTVERKIFEWIGAFHTDGKDEYWTETPWGRTGESGGTAPGVPENFSAVVEGENVRLTWDAVDGADSYQLVHTEHPPMFLTLYEGADTEYLHLNPPGGTHYYQVRGKSDDTPGDYTDSISVEITGVVPGPPVNLQVVIMSDGKVKFMWDSPATGVPEYCNFYLAIVGTGTPPPEKPDVPYREEIITNMVIIDNPGPGKTVYGWATAFSDGMEGEAAGPVSIEIV